MMVLGEKFTTETRRHGEEGKRARDVFLASLFFSSSPCLRVSVVKFLSLLFLTY
jgi:hypothetical protein